MKENKNQLLWYNLALIAFAGVWGFGNVVSNYSQQGISVIISWVFIMALFFIPYVLMVGELGSTFSKTDGGVSSWIKNTSNARLAYFAAWTYWIVHIPYMAQKPQKSMIAFSWGITLDPTTLDKFSTILLQVVYIGIFLFFVYLASRGIRSLKILGTIAGSLMFIMSILYILLGISAIMFMNIDFATTDITFQSLIPHLNLGYLTTLSLLVLAVGGIEKVSPYIKDTKDAKRNFPKAMIAVAIMVTISAIFGSIAMAAMFDSNNIPTDLITNGEYYAFDMLGSWYGMGHIFTRVYAFTNMAAQFTALLLAIDAPLKILTSDKDSTYVPKGLMVKNKYDAPTRAYALASALVILLLVLPMFSSGDTNSVYTWLLKLNGVVMPLRYLWVFIAYILLKKSINKFTPGYVFINNKKVGIAIGAWCFGFTLMSCIFGMVPTGGIVASPIVFIVNLITPIILLGLGLILPIFAKNEAQQIK